MGSLPTGSEEKLLLEIRTDQLVVTIKGKAEHPSTPGVVYDKPCAHFRCKANGICKDFHVLVEGREIAIGPDKTVDILLPPLFFEQQAYSTFIGSKKAEDEVSLRHFNQNVRRSLTHPSSEIKNTLYGDLNFKSDIGLSDFFVLINGQDYLAFTLEVFPCKIDYQKDYQAIMADVTSEIYSLIFDFLKRTYQNFDVGQEAVTSPVEFFEILSKIYREYLRSADIILNQPHHVLTKEYHQVPFYKAKSLDRRCEKWLVNHPSHLMLEQDKVQVDRCLAVHKQVTVNTRENRMVKFILSETLKQLEAFLANYRGMDRKEDTVISSQIERMANGIRRRLSSSVLQEVPIEAERIELSSVFAMAAGYRALFKYFLMLKRGLSISGGCFNMSIKDVAQLYEYWCFIKLNHLLRDKYHLVSQDFITVNDNGLFVTLAKGGVSVVTYTNPNKPGDIIQIAYNKDYQSSSTETVPQKPDNVLSLTKANKIDGKTDFSYVFDAKYRLDPATGDDYGKRHKNLPGPQEDDINTMHRYRDAIMANHRSNGEYRHAMFGAYVLFPYHDEDQYVHQDFYKSIQSVNIGGLPFLPGSTRLVEKMLDVLIEESPDSAFSRTVLPAGIEEKLATVDWNRRDVLVGVLARKEQLDQCLEKKCYWIPANQIQESDLPIHYVALYQSENLFKKDAGITYYGEVLLCQKRFRKNIPISQGIKRNDNQIYYYFSVKDWLALPVRILPKESAKVALFTNTFLLKHAESYPELRINSEDEFRLSYELKWLLKMSEVNDTDPRELRFICQGTSVFIQNDRICLADSKGTVTYSKPISAFHVRPGEVMSDLMASIKGAHIEQH